jgi:hypothetical protein
VQRAVPLTRRDASPKSQISVLLTTDTVERLRDLVAHETDGGQAITMRSFIEEALLSAYDVRLSSAIDAGRLHPGAHRFPVRRGRLRQGPPVGQPNGAVTAVRAATPSS